MNRRAFFTGAGIGAAGLAVGATAGSLVSREVTKDPDPEGVVLEAAQAADEGTRPARIGNHRLIWNFETTEPFAAITFDDGPTPEFTPKILDALDKAGGIKATFNVMGYNGTKHPSILKEVVAAGHEIGNHTMTHQDLAFLTEPQTKAEIVDCKDAIEQILQEPFSSFRPPRGEITGSAMKYCAQFGYDVYVWSVTRGPGGPGRAKEVAAYMGGIVRPGDVLGLHDGIGRGTFAPGTAFQQGLSARRTVEVEALPEALKRIADRGITLTSANRLRDMVYPSEAEG